ncbi:hypothetical protein [Neptuniibacter halophilus]|uniref:hypothetical protein n=1 Tax=Neptuniibacter halophilus TaxID=651666 RepID=UPI002572385C|nr:hypothetical protein [Neptuniibacter halophilus]
MRRSKYNKQKRLRRTAAAVLRHNHVAAAFVGGNNGYSHMVNHKSRLTITPDQTLIDVMTELSFKWSTLIAVMCCDEFGQHYMKSEHVDIDIPLKQNELALHLNDMHFDLIKACNDKHIINVGWISSPFPIEWDEGQASEIFEKLGGWKVVPIKLIEEAAA